MTSSDRRFDCVARARELGTDFASRAAEHDAEDSFVAENYAKLKEHKLFSAGVPAELGGGGATHRELCEMLREIGRHCGSTALALSMHTHLLAATVWRWKHGDTVVEALLRRIAAEELVLVSSGGSDWLDGSGVAEPVEGGFKVTARKIFGSGSPSGELLMTTAVYDDPTDGRVVLHLPVPLSDPAVKVQDNWRTLGMRGTGSNDVLLQGIFVPEKAIGMKRPQGKWHRFFDVISPVVWPLVMAAYVGVADAARDVALREARRKREDRLVQLAVGEMDTLLAGADIALEALIRLANEYDYAPDIHRSNKVYMYKTLAARSLLGAVEKALEVTGGASFFRSLGLERLFRDAQGVRFHPFQEKRQFVFSGRVALELSPID